MWVLVAHIFLLSKLVLVLLGIELALIIKRQAKRRTKTGTKRSEVHHFTCWRLHSPCTHNLLIPRCMNSAFCNSRHLSPRQSHRLAYGTSSSCSNVLLFLSLVVYFLSLYLHSTRFRINKACSSSW